FSTPLHLDLLHAISNAEGACNVHATLSPRSCGLSVSPCSKPNQSCCLSCGVVGETAFPRRQRPRTNRSDRTQPAAARQARRTGVSPRQQLRSNSQAHPRLAERSRRDFLQGRASRGIWLEPDLAG